MATDQFGDDKDWVASEFHGNADAPLPEGYVKGVEMDVIAIDEASKFMNSGPTDYALFYEPERIDHIITDLEDIRARIIIRFEENEYIRAYYVAQLTKLLDALRNYEEK